MARKARRNKEYKPYYPEEIAKIGGGGYLAYAGVRSGAPRALGVRLERHVTSKKNLPRIFKDKNKRVGYLDPNKGGSNVAGKAEYQWFDAKEKAKGYTYATGYHPDNPKIGKPKLKDPFRTLYRKAQEIDYSIQNKRLNGGKTKRLYVPGSDEFFNKNFIPDPDELAAQKSSKPVAVFKNRFDAVAHELKRRKASGIKVKDFKRRGVGVAFLGAGLYGATRAASGVNNVFVKAFTRKDGTRVKSHSKKRKR